MNIFGEIVFSDNSLLRENSYTTLILLRNKQQGKVIEVIPIKVKDVVNRDVIVKQYGYHNVQWIKSSKK